MEARQTEHSFGSTTASPSELELEFGVDCCTGAMGIGVAGRGVIEGSGTKVGDWYAWDMGWLKRGGKHRLKKCGIGCGASLKYKG